MSAGIIFLIVYLSIGLILSGICLVDDAHEEGLVYLSDVGVFMARSIFWPFIMAFIGDEIVLWRRKN